MQEKENFVFEGIEENPKVSVNVWIEVDGEEVKDKVIQYLKTTDLGKVVGLSESVNNADLIIRGKNGNYEISTTKNWLGSSKIIKEGISDLNELKESIINYAEGKSLRELSIQGSEEIFSFKLLKVDYDAENEQILKVHKSNDAGIFQVVPHKDFVILEITNHSSSPISVEILEINTPGEVTPFFPNDPYRLTNAERIIKPGGTITYKDCIYSFAPPYETLMLKGIAKIPKTDKTDSIQKTYVYVKSFEYEIVRETGNSLEDIVAKHSKMSSSFNIISDFQSGQRAYKQNFSRFQNKKHSEADILKFVKSYTKNTGLCIYTYMDDKLNVLLYTKEGKIYDKSFPVTKEKLINDISIINSDFSNRSLHRSPALRGSEPIQTAISLAEKKKLLNAISKMLLPPAEFLDEIEHLIIVPTLNIATIPFYALQFSKEGYLVDRMSYSIAPGLIELLFRIDENNPYQRKKSGYVRYHFENALLVANPTFSVNGKWNFPSLPGTEEEIDAIAQLIGAYKYTLLKGDESTSEKVFHKFKRADLLYFATHGIADPENPLDNSFLALARDDDFVFSARRIQHEEIAANLVVLSACQTGLGQTHDGGVIGLARAFQLAGANNVLSSLWNIDDKETVTIMTDFFKNIKRGGELMPHEALRQAILKYKNEVNSDPYFWSAFMIFGVPY